MKAARDFLSISTMVFFLAVGRSMACGFCRKEAAFRYLKRG